MEHSASPAPSPLTGMLSPFRPFLFLALHSKPTSLISQTRHSGLFFPYLAKGRMTRIKLVLARPSVIVPPEPWQVSEPTMIDHPSRAWPLWCSDMGIKGRRVERGQREYAAQCLSQLASVARISIRVISYTLAAVSVCQLMLFIFFPKSRSNLKKSSC